MFPLKACLRANPILPSVANEQELEWFFSQTRHRVCCLKTGDINTLDSILNRIQKQEKHALVHLDSIRGVAKDREGIEYLAALGTEAVITMKSQQVRLIQDEGLFTILGSFLIDSSAVQQTLNNIRQTKPDAALIMPMSVPRFVYEKLRQVAPCLLAGGMGAEHEIIQSALDYGAAGCIVTSPQRLAEEYRVG